MTIQYSDCMRDCAKGNTKKYITIGIGCIVLFCVAVFFIMIYFKNAQTEDGVLCYNTPQELADAFVTATYVNDTDTIFMMMPKAMQIRALSDIQATHGIEDTEGAMEKYRTYLADYISTMNQLHGDAWSETHTVLDTLYTYTDEELDDLNLKLKMQGVEDLVVDKAVIVEVDVDLVASNGTGGYRHVVDVPVIKIGRKWYLGQRIGAEFEKRLLMKYDPYGSLLDGFHVIGEFDADGNRIIRNEYGQRILSDENGQWFSHDIYGNIVYYNDAYEQIDITGPDGGEPLTEETCEAYFQ